MNRSRGKASRRPDYVVIDIILLNLSFFISYCIEFGFRRNPYMVERWRNIAIVMTLLDVVIVLFMDHDKEERSPVLTELLSVFQQVLILELILTFYLYAIRSGVRYSRTVIFLTGILLIPLDTAVRCLWNRFRAKRIPRKQIRVAVMGPEAVREQAVKAVAETKPGERVAAELPMDEEALPRLEKLLEANQLDSVILMQDGSPAFGEAIFLCEKYGCRISVVPSFQGAMSASATVEPLGGMKMLDFRVSPLDNPGNAMLKRFVDIVGSVLLMILTSPLMLMAAIGTKLSSPGPILFRQARVGKYRKPFEMLKFRSMRVTGTEDTGWSTDRDPRKTKFGSFIRKFSIDELPQLWNVLMGDMSLIGPRPEVPYHVAHFKEEIHSYLVRQQVKPGMTGWAQVHGLRGNTSIQDRISYDIWYIENWTFGLDIEILLRTAFGGMINHEALRTSETESDGGKGSAEG